MRIQKPQIQITETIISNKNWVLQSFPEINPSHATTGISTGRSLAQKLNKWSVRNKTERNETVQLQSLHAMPKNDMDYDLE